MKEYPERSLNQNRALHAYCEDIAREATNAGIEVQAFVKNTRASITPALVKEIWRAFAKVKFGKDHTSQLTTKELKISLGEALMLLEIPDYIG